MIRMLRITSVAVAILASLVLASVLGRVSFLGFDASRDEGAAKALSSPSAIERFKNQQGNKAPSSQDTTPLLVRQAEALANILNPPAQSQEPPVRVAGRTPTRTAEPPRASVNFALVGTSYSAASQEESFAYIRFPDNTYQWVRQGSEVGHIVVKNIKSGSIVYWDGQRDSEMTVEPMPDTANLLEAGGTDSTPTASGLPQPATARPAGRPASRPVLSRPSVAAANTSSRMSEQDKEALSELVDKLKRSFKPDEADPNMTPAGRAAMMNKLISEFKSSRVSDEEAEKLEDLGKQLNGAKEAPTAERRREFMRRLTAPRSTKR